MEIDDKHASAGAGVADAIALHEAKGNVVNARRCRELPDALAAEVEPPDA